jgi:hypothetical protein
MKFLSFEIYEKEINLELVEGKKGNNRKLKINIDIDLQGFVSKKF